MDARSRSPRAHDPRPSGRHFLKSRRIADELVAQAGITTEDLVLEIGAGSGRITTALAGRGARVIAVELAPDLVRRLRRTFQTQPRVEVLEGDFLELALPRMPFRAFGNVPFALTTAILRRLLDDPSSWLTRADLLVQYEVARKRASPWPSRLLSLGWLPWWEFTLVRRLPRQFFEPPPSVDVGVLRITRRQEALLPPDQRPPFVRMLRAGFRRSSQPVRHSVPGLGASTWIRLARERCLRLGATATELDVFDWIEVFRAVQGAVRGRWSA